ncbi:MAG TPA: putative manganese-dependent inorganic diphosphatase [Candidatus Anaerostipes avistercoris]|uniref:inorganic diphosphatase n=1 Tax=Candidatus Anaerostipes avistercoris TaxID=2838462 RepID=A0A9D2PKA5_9FIRM|nr:putative manganese-dependent inorganic diphosphatase [uncultured Anaerostipes sp.]HJC50433.1 putative manganese-dependent inorganic diphosphatase [Candidatus Anaerostipes avistercoris]
MKKIYVIGHRNPDTDSICSALAYANLKNQTSDGEFEYEACRAGNVNGETKFVLEHFGVKAPEYVNDMRPRVTDININRIEGVEEECSIKEAGDRMRQIKQVSLPVLRDRDLKGIVTISDIAYADMDVFDNEILAKSKTPYKNLISVLNGEMLVGSEDGVIENGKLSVSAASIEKMSEFIKPGDVVILANRADVQKAVIDIGAQCIIACMGTNLDEEVLNIAKEKGCRVIATGYDTFIASRLICQAIPVSYAMTPKDKLAVFSINDFVDDVKEEMTQKRFRYFPVLDADNKFVGLVSRRRLLEIDKKRLILVDHNEVSQAVEGLEECEIQEIIDHHRIGSLETMSPVYFRNQPVGCTATIVTQMYREQGVEITKPIAGLLCSAILSDTLMFRSPTCTPVDEQIARELAQIAEIDVEDYAKQMFRAGSDLKGKAADEIFYQDYKKFTANDVTFGVGQITSLDQSELDEIKEKILPYMESVRKEQGLNMVFFMLTNILEETTYLAMTGDESKEVIENAFQTETDGQIAVLPGVMSRKKQLIPNVLNIVQE